MGRSLKAGAKAHLRRTQRSAGVRLLEDWGWLDEPEPRLSFIRWLRALPIVGRMMRIYHFQLGKAAG